MQLPQPATYNITFNIGIHHEVSQQNSVVPITQLDLYEVC